MREDGFKVWIASSKAFEKMHSGPYEKAASNPYDDGDIAIDIPSSGPSSVEGQQSEEEMLVMMEESGMDPSEIVSVLQLDAGNIVMWVCLIGCCCFGCNTINLCGYNGAEDHSRNGLNGCAHHKQQAILCIHHHEMVKQLDDKVNLLEVNQDR